MKINLQGKIALITGSSRGIGCEIAKLFANNGATIAIHFNQRKEKAEAVTAGLSGQGHVTVQADLSQKEAAKALVEDTLRKLGRIDILVNNAGIYEEHPPMDIGYEKWMEIWAKTLQINLLSAANISYCVIQHMKKLGGGKIINISSRGAFRGEPTAPAYGASKGGLNSMGQSLAKALAADGIFVYTIAPGFVETDMAREFLDGPEGAGIKSQSPLGRVAKPIEIANTAAFLAADGSEFLTGGIIDINGASYLRS